MYGVEQVLSNSNCTYFRSSKYVRHRWYLPNPPSPIRSGVGGSNRTICKTIDTFLLSLYNSEVADRAGQPHEAQIRLPNLMQSSLYHDCSRIDLDSGVVSNNAAQTGPAAANANLQLTLRLYKQGHNSKDELTSCQLIG